MLIRATLFSIGRAISMLAALALVAGCAGPLQPDSGRRQARVDSAGTVMVRKGDNLYRISRRHNVPLRDLITLNRIPPPYTIYSGQRIRLPRARVHVVARGETLRTVSRRHGVETTRLARANRLESPYPIRPGQRLRLPERAKPDAAKRPPRRPAKTRKAPVRPSSVSIGKPAARSSARFLWPVHGPISIGFGPRGAGLHNDGINILARRGTRVRAAENGIVAYSGNEIRGFGNLILIKHSGGWMSAYAHNQDLLVRAGDRIRRGQTISRVGSTGNVVRPQLHFELRRGRRVVNPVPHLGPARQSIGGLDRASGPTARPGPG